MAYPPPSYNQTPYPPSATDQNPYPPSATGQVSRYTVGDILYYVVNVVTSILIPWTSTGW